jgi:hypothetical protein
MISSCHALRQIVAIVSNVERAACLALLVLRQRGETSVPDASWIE